MYYSPILPQLRQQKPLIHTITNYVVAQFVANGLLAIGASPIMATAIEEMAELAQKSDAIAINLGTLTQTRFESILASGTAAAKCGMPLLLDPVGVGATRFRYHKAQTLLSALPFRVIRGNVGEIATLANIDWHTKGVDSGTGNHSQIQDLSQIAKSLALQYKCIVIMTGESDIISDGTQVIQVQNGTPLFPKITGSGCLHGAFCAGHGRAHKTRYAQRLR